jgi:polygalacturonase
MTSLRSLPQVVGDGQALDSPAIQHQIDALAARGGGTVYLPAGTYRCGTLHLRSRITLHLDPGATLLGSTDLRDYPPTGGDRTRPGPPSAPPACGP